MSGNVQGAGGGTRGFPHKVDGSEGHEAGGWDMEKRGRGEGNQGSRYSDTGDLHLQEAGNSGGVGGFEADT